MFRLYLTKLKIFNILLNVFFLFLGIQLSNLISVFSLGKINIQHKKAITTC